jgi:two-component system NtrC family sensor kinase
MKRFYLPLFWKLTIGISAIIIVLGTISAVLIWRNVAVALQKESQKRGHYIAHSLAIQATDPLVYEDRISLQKLIDNVNQVDSTVEYAFILGADNEVLVHNFSDHVPPELINANPVKKDQSENVVLIKSTGDTHRKIIRDIAEPVLEGKIGTIRIGISEQGIRKEVQKTIRTLLITVGVFLVIGNLMAGVFAFLLTSPIKAISRVTERLDLDALKLDSHPNIRIRNRFLGRIWPFVYFRDELDFLAEKFNSMVDRISNTYQELEKAQTSLIQSEKLAYVGTLAAEIAHEINNPIAGLKNCIRRMQQNPHNILQNKEYLDMMEEAALKMESVVCGLLDYTRQEKMVFEQIRINEVIEKALFLITYKIEIYQIEIINHISAGLPAFYGSFNHIEQVFVNLLINGINAINEICKLDTECKRQIYLSGEVNNSSLVIRVEDTGTGISSAEKEKIFDPFYTTKEIGVGTGLGLSICYNIIKAHKGEIKVESQVGKGTAFTVSLPFRAET